MSTRRTSIWLANRYRRDHSQWPFCPTASASGPKKQGHHCTDSTSSPSPSRTLSSAPSLGITRGVRRRSGPSRRFSRVGFTRRRSTNPRSPRPCHQFDADRRARQHATAFERKCRNLGLYLEKLAFRPIGRSSAPERRRRTRRNEPPPVPTFRTPSRCKVSSVSDKVPTISNRPGYGGHYRYVFSRVAHHSGLCATRTDAHQVAKKSPAGVTIVSDGFSVSEHKATRARNARTQPKDCQHGEFVRVY